MTQIPGRLINGEVSFWWRNAGLPSHRASLPGSITADVCIVGAGYTGLWTAYYLKKEVPDLEVVVVEARHAGFGASGRNGGWLSNSVTGGRHQYAIDGDRSSAIAQQRALNGSVDEVIRVANHESIDADVHRGGELMIARTPAQLTRLQSASKSENDWPATDTMYLSASETASRVQVDGVLGGMWHPHGARIQPAKLVMGLAAAVERLGVTIYENTPVTEIAPGCAHTLLGRVQATHVIRATEGFTATLRGERRTWLPMNSSLIVTEPLSSETWSQIGWAGREILGDFAHAYCYAQRTADDRIAIGGRGKPYRFGSRTDTDGVTQPATIAKLTDLLHRIFPPTRDSAIAHAWSGVLGVPRDWSASVGYDHQSGLGWAGGYVGTGVAASNLAGRTLADLISRRDSELTQLPWVGHRARRWEPEPLRWLGVQSMYRAYHAADRQEAGGRVTTAPLARIAGRVSGR